MVICLVNNCHLLKIIFKDLVNNTSINKIHLKMKMVSRNIIGEKQHMIVQNGLDMLLNH